MIRSLVPLLLLLLLPRLAAAQWSTLRTRVVTADGPVVLLDSLPVAPPLLGVRDSATGQPLPDSLFALAYNRLRIDTAALRRVCAHCGPLIVRFRVLPFDLAAPVSRLDTATIRRAIRTDAIEFDYSPYEPPSRPWDNSGLTTNGAYTRGLSFGNNQNLVFNSNLNLQLDGKLGNDIELQAALSDNSIPLQPDGTTRQLQEFDRIFIQLRRKNVGLTAGDYDLTRPAGYFSNYFKRLQGAAVDYQQHNLLGRADASDTLSMRVAAAVSRGKFARQLFQGQEGNQGPYRLQGAEGERFIIVLAGTERVFLDGQLLARGLDADYVIDYNVGEITFTPRRLITKDSRIIVEFEYAVQAYLRSTLAVQSQWALPRGRLYFNLYTEQDNKSAGGAQDLGADDRRRLALAGDDPRGAYTSGVDTLDDQAFDPSRVYYRYLDTLDCAGQPLRVLRYTANPDSARFTARFTEVPAGQGHYVQVVTAANGRVFRWVAPDPVTCQPRGNFEPVVRLIAPEQRQLFTLGGTWRTFRRGSVQAEAALSNTDRNRFSPLGQADNRGLGAYVGARQPLLPAGRPWQLAAHGQYEYAARNFLPLNPYRPAEFVRDWNVAAAPSATANGNPAALPDTTTEHLARAGFTLERQRLGVARYEYGTFVRLGAYDGRRHLAQARAQRAGFDLLLEINELTTSSPAERTRFSRPKLDFSKTFTVKTDSARVPLFKLGVYAERERNERRSADTLVRTSFWYDLTRFYTQTANEAARWQLGASVSRRLDYAPRPSFLQLATVADEANINGRWSNSGSQSPSDASNKRINNPTNQQLSWNVTWRRLAIANDELTPLQPQNTYLGRLDYNLSAFRNALSWTTGYEVGSGQSPKVEFSYLRVNPGEGQYTWIDRNRDSLIQVDEMELAVFQDQATFVRVAVTTNDFIRTNNAVLSQNLRFDPRVLWATAPRRSWKRMASRVSTQSTLQLNRRVLAGARGVSAWNPLELAVADTALVTVGATVRNVLFLNRADPAWDASFTHTDARTRANLTTGFETRQNTDFTGRARVNLGPRWSSELEATRGARNSDHQVFASRDFAIRSWQYGPRLTWVPGRSFRLVASFTRETGRNTLASEVAEKTDWTLETTVSGSGRSSGRDGGRFQGATSIRANATFAQVAYNAEPNSAVAYALLEGLQNGRNFLWTLSLDRQLSRTMQLSVQYEGRKTGETRTVHVGRAQVRALF